MPKQGRPNVTYEAYRRVFESCLFSYRERETLFCLIGVELVLGVGDRTIRIAL